MQKIAIITDSASDIPLEIIKEKNINLLPLRIIYSHGDYQDKLDITPEEIYLNLDKEIPKTSLISASEKPSKVRDIIFWEIGINLSKKSSISCLFKICGTTVIKANKLSIRPLCYSYSIAFS